MNPHWKVICFNETRHWDEQFLARLGITKVWGLYLFNANEQVHCCELTPSYELWPLESSAVWRDSEAPLDHFDEFQGADSGSKEVLYYHCHVIDRALPDRIYDLGEEELDGATLDEAREEMLAVLAGNPRYPDAVILSW